MRMLPWLGAVVVLLALGGCCDDGDQSNDQAVTGQRVFIAVHCEPGPTPASTDYAGLTWPSLVQLVDSADRSNLALTLMLNPQWAMHIVESQDRLALARDWEANGHEFALHHHGPHMNAWNGYTDQEAYSGSPEYLGTIADMMAAMNQLPEFGQIQTACVTVEDQPFDFPGGVVYATNGGADKLDDLWSTPTPQTWNGQNVLQLSHARYAASFNEVNIDLRQMERILNDGPESEVMGLVFHCFEYADNPAAFDALFRLLDERGATTQSVAAIIEAWRR